MKYSLKSYEDSNILIEISDGGIIYRHKNNHPDKTEIDDAFKILKYINRCLMEMDDL